MVCDKCWVVDENILIFSIKGQYRADQFIIMFDEKKCRFCMSDKLRKKYFEILNYFNWKSEYVNDLVLKIIKTLIMNRDELNYCQYPSCDEEQELNSRYLAIPRKDRFLVVIVDHFNTKLITEDVPLRDALNGLFLSQDKRGFSINDGIKILNES